MRKITKEASEAFKAEINNDSENYQPLPYDKEKVVFSKDNTQVVIYWTKGTWEGRDKHTLLKLHGNTISHHVQNLFSGSLSQPIVGLSNKRVSKLPMEENMALASIEAIRSMKMATQMSF